ncbi:sodium:dicarboxylate symporter [Natrialba aegyptia DSM 13077]|uniref:Sodium:dicarboxylate symporter n=1 Tax=Natrialba aegyptia DSM 13077 TaxID=1227491 RepID=M0B4N2_9EURY|nr:sodium:dicarboxylate symporter [Natrialba aegyptia DSM 13077]
MWGQMTNISGNLAVTTVVGRWNDAVEFSAGVWNGESPTERADG